MNDSQNPQPTIILAAPARRYDRLEERLRQRLKNDNLVRLRSKLELSIQTLEQIKPRLIFFPHWSWQIPEEIYRQFECVIFHMTDVPYGRGGSPLQNLIVRGHRETVLTALRCEGEVDAGPVYLKSPLTLDGTAEEIFARAAHLMEQMVIEIVTHRPAPTPQSGDVVSFTRRGPQDGNLAQLQELEQIYDHVRMLDAEGYPPAFIETENFRIEFNNARLSATCVEANVRIRKKS